MAKNSVLVAVIIVCILFQSTASKRIFIKHSGSTNEGQRVKTIASNIGRVVHEFPEISSSSVEVSDDFDIGSLSDLDVEEVPQGQTLATPNDAYYGNQWGIPYLQLDQVWDLVPWTTVQPANISLAICDTGIALNHPDLDTSRIIWGYNYVSNTNNIAEDNYHGTHVAGIAAATINNGEGVAGVAYGVNLMIGKTQNGTGWGWYDDWIKCITETTDAGADIINLSVGGTAYNSQLEAAVNYAVQRGVLVVASAGNSYMDTNNPPIYPGAFDSSLTVANLQSDGTRHILSTTNSFVDIAAPGTDIWSAFPYSNYGPLTGTSMAAPFVAGIAALMMAIKPGITTDEVRTLLTTTAIDIGAPGKDDEFGYGKINPLQAAKVLLNQPPVITVNTNYDLVVAVESFDSCVSLTATGELPAFMTVSQLSSTVVVVSATPVVADGSSTQVTFTAVDTFNTVTSVTVAFTVPNPPQSVPITPMSEEPSTTPSMSTSPSSNTPASSVTPSSSIVSSAIQQPIIDAVFVLVLVFGAMLI